MSYKLLNKGVMRLVDNANIPDDIRNKDWKEYQDWLAQGNIPQPKDPDPPPIDLSNLDNLDKIVKAIGLTIAEVSGRTPAQIRTIFKQKYDLL